MIRLCKHIQQADLKNARGLEDDTCLESGGKVLKMILLPAKITVTHNGYTQPVIIWLKTSHP